MKKKLLSLLLKLPLFGLLFLSPSLSAHSKEETQNATVAVQTSDQIAKIDTFLHTIEKRLALMPEIASWKWNHAKPILETDREEAQVGNIALMAQEKGLDPSVIETFFRNQFEAAKLIQIEAFEQWVQEGAYKVAEGRDLNEIHPVLDHLNEELLAQFNEIKPFLKNPQFKELLKERAAEVLKEHSPEVREASLESFIS